MVTETRQLVPDRAELQRKILLPTDGGGRVFPDEVILTKLVPMSVYACEPMS
jgi:hypothetical protein